MAKAIETATVEREPKPSLVDIAEESLRTWLGSSRHRLGERLPPEQELSARLGISRGTLRTALRRLEESGEIVRRQGSGTYVGKLTSATFEEGLERLVSYAELARQRGVTIEAAEATIEELPVGRKIGELLGIPSDTTAVTCTRVLMLDGEPWAYMRDVVHPDAELPSPARLRQSLERGQMVLDVLKEQGIPVAYARTHVTARTVSAEDPVGNALGVSGTSAALELEHVTCTGDGVPVEHSTDIFLPGRLDLHVIRQLEEPPPVPTIERSRPARATRRS
jgi:GntR family transcriptional regulator